MPPIVQTRATKTVIQTDFANVVETPTSGYVEVEVTMDSDGVLRFYAQDTGGGGGGELTDGDKGDITVSSSGAVWTIDAAAVTYAKIQNVTDARLLGRSAGSAGSPQEITIGAGLALASGQLATSGLLTDSAFEASDTMKIVGRYTASGGPLEELSIGSGLNVNGAGTISVAQVDHGSLSGLADDDHSQYHNDTRGDARYSRVLEADYGNPITTVSATALTAVYSVTIPANTLPSRCVRVTIRGDILQNSGSNQAVAMRFRINGTSYAHSSSTFNNATNRYGFEAVFNLSPRAASAEFLYGEFKATTTTAGTTGIGGIGTNSRIGQFYNAAVAVDETSSMSVEVQMSLGSTTSSEIRIYETSTTLVPYA